MCTFLCVKKSIFPMTFMALHNLASFYPCTLHSLILTCTFITSQTHKPLWFLLNVQVWSGLRAFFIIITFLLILFLFLKIFTWTTLMSPSGLCTNTTFSVMTSITIPFKIATSLLLHSFLLFFFIFLQITYQNLTFHKFSIFVYIQLSLMKAGTFVIFLFSSA